MFSPHPDEHPDGNDQPAGVCCEHERQMVAGERSRDLFTENDGDRGEHHGCPDDRPVADPLLAFPERVQRGDVEGPVYDLIDDDDRGVPDWPFIEQRVVVREIPVQEVDHVGRRPDRVGEVVRVANDELLDVGLVGDEDDVHQEEDPQDDVALALAERDDLTFDGNGCCFRCVGHQLNSIGRLVGPLRPSRGFHGTVPTQRGLGKRLARSLRASASSNRARLAPRQ